MSGDADRGRRTLFRPPVRQEVDEELSFHIEMRVRELVESGASARDARAAAVARFGDIEEVRHACERLGAERDRRVHRLALLGELRQDIGYALRVLRRSPGYTTIAVLTLALGIGATAAIFGVLDAVLLRSQPYPAADRIVVPQSVDGHTGSRWSVTYGDFEDWQEAGVFEHVALYRPRSVNVTGGAQAERLSALTVTPAFFDALGATPVWGRGFTAAEHEPGAPDVAVLTSGLARRLFGSAEAAVGASLSVAGGTVQVVGVIPLELAYPSTTELWLPLRLTAEDLITYRRRDNFVFSGIARLRADRTLEQTQAELGVLAQRVADSGEDRREGITVTATSLTAYLVGDGLARGLWVVMGAVVFILLIACVNLANLLLSRSAARQQELSIRAALGAGRARMTRQLLTESLVLGFAGCAAGLMVASVAVRGLVRLAPASIPRIEYATIDLRVGLFAAVAALGAVLLSGLAPALLGARAGSAAVGGTTRITSGRRDRLVRSALVSAELALSVVLLIGAGLFLRSFAAARAADPGIETSGLLTFQLSLQGDRYAERSTRPAVYDAVLERLRSEPSVVTAAITSSMPLGGGGAYLGRVFLLEGAPEPPAGPETRSLWMVVSPGYFETIGTPLLRGRDFTPTDAAAAVPVAVISRSFARQMFGDADPLGQRVRSWRDENVYREVVGVVDDVRVFGAEEEVQPVFYVPYAQDAWGGMVVIVRAARDAAALVPAARRAVLDVDASLAIGSVMTGDDIVSRTHAQRKFATWLLGAFAALALLLAVIGVYGVLAYNVAQRRREIGIRMALGATRRGVVWLVLRDAARVLSAGVLIGVAGAIALGRVTAALLYDVAPTDPLTYVAASGLLLAVAFAASLLPARAAARLDPVDMVRG